MSDQEFTLPLDANAIRAILPHRYPFLLVDRVLENDPGKLIVARKCVSQNEPFFEGHFPQLPVMPGVLQIEALAQTGAINVLLNPANRGKIALLAGAENFKFRRQVVPGDVLELRMEITRLRGNFGKAHGIASVDGEVTTEGDLSFAIADAE